MEPSKEQIDEMPDLTQLTERGSKAWSTLDKNQKSWNVQSPTEADAQMKSAFEAKYQRDWNDPAGDEMKAVWADAWGAAICALTHRDRATEGHPMTPTTTSGAADLPEALKHAEGLESFAEHLPAYGFDSKPLKEAAATIRRLHALLEAEDAAHCNTIEQRDEAEKLGTMLANAVAEHFRVEVGEYSNLNDPRLVALEILDGGYITDSDADRKIAALAAGQATAAPAQPAAQQGVAYAATPTSNYAGRVYEEGFLIGTCPLYTADQLRAFADATYALRASHGQAPAGATEPTEQQILEAAEKAGLWPNTVHSWIPAFHRYHKELAKAQPAQAQEDSVHEDAARLDWLLLRISGAEFRRLGVHYSGNARRADVDAARKQGANHDNA